MRRGRPRTENNEDAIFPTKIPLARVFQMYAPDRSVLFFGEPEDGGEPVLIGLSTGTSRAIKKMATDIEMVFKRAVEFEPRLQWGKYTQPGAVLQSVGEGVYNSRDGKLSVQEFTSGAWVRQFGTATGRGPYGDAIRYEPTLARAVRWAEAHLTKDSE